MTGNASELRDTFKGQRSGPLKKLVLRSDMLASQNGSMQNRFVKERISSKGVSTRSVPGMIGRRQHASRRALRTFALLARLGSGLYSALLGACRVRRGCVRACAPPPPAEKAPPPSGARTPRQRNGRARSRPPPPPPPQSAPSLASSCRAVLSPPQPAPSAPFPPPSLGFGGGGVNGTGPAAELWAAGGTRASDRVVVPAAAAET